MKTPPAIDWNNIAEVQDEINRWASGNWPDRTFKQTFDKLVYEEIPELLIHYRSHKTRGIDTELADCFILLMDLATMWQVDLAHAIYSKMQILYGEQWETDPDTGIAKRLKLPQVLESGVDYRYNPNNPCPHCLKGGSTREITEQEIKTTEAVYPDFVNAFCKACLLYFDSSVPF